MNEWKGRPKLDWRGTQETNHVDLVDPDKKVGFL